MALTRMRAILGVGGILRLSDIVFSFEPREAADRIEQWCATLPVDAPDGEWVRADIEEHIRDEHSTHLTASMPITLRRRSDSQPSHTAGSSTCAVRMLS